MAEQLVPIQALQAAFQAIAKLLEIIAERAKQNGLSGDDLEKAIVQMKKDALDPSTAFGKKVQDIAKNPNNFDEQGNLKPEAANELRELVFNELKVGNKNLQPDTPVVKAMGDAAIAKAERTGAEEKHRRELAAPQPGLGSSPNADIQVNL
jgi:hypothetical protein